MAFTGTRRRRLEVILGPRMEQEGKGAHDVLPKRVFMHMLFLSHCLFQAQTVYFR
jgi:hypothetical protein